MSIDRTQARIAFASIIAVTTVLANTLTVGIAHAQNLSGNPHDMRDAFAKHGANVNTPQTFAKFVDRSDALKQRYARHFSVPEDQVVNFFRTSLVPYNLPNTQTLTTYGVTNSGMIYPVKTTLPKGTRVWATREGTPVLKWNCSNPLVSVLPGSTLTPPIEVASTTSPVLPEDNIPMLAVPETFATVSSPSLPEGGIAAVTPSMPDASSFSFAVPSTSDVSSSELPGIGEIVESAGPSIKDLWPALLVPVFFVGGSSSGGSGESEPFLPPPVVVPEGNTMALVGLGLPMLGLAGLIARRRK